MTAFEIEQQHRAALAPTRHDARDACPGPGVGRRDALTVRIRRWIGVIALTGASLAFAASIALASAGDREACAASADNSEQKIASCDRVISDDAETAAARAAAYESRGTAYYNKGDFDHAIADFNAAIKLDASASNRYFALAYYRRGLGFADKRDFDRAIADYDESIRLDPGSFVARKDRGIAYENKRDFDRAIADYDEAIRLDPTYAVVYNNRGFSYLRKGDMDKAIADYTEAIGRYPNYAVAYNNRGLAYVNKRDLDRAIADFSDAIKHNPELAIAYDNRGFAYASRGDYEHALPDYDEAIRRNPRLARPYAHRGALYWTKGDYNRAIAELTTALALDASYVYAYDNRCNAYNAKAEYDSAIVDCTAAIMLNPKDGYAYASRSFARAAKRDYDAAIADGSEAIRLNPQAGFGYNSRGSAYRLKKDYDAAIADFNEAIRLEPKLAPTYGNRGATYRDKGDTAEAIADFGRAIEINPRYFQAYNARGKIYAAKGENASAIADYGSAIKLNPRFVEAYDNRGLAYLALHQTADAVADFKAAQAIDPADMVSKNQLAFVAPAVAPAVAAASAAMNRLSINLPAAVAGVDPVKAALEQLNREPCDQQAIGALDLGLEKVGRKREAATAQLSFSRACGGHALSLRSAANLLLALSDNSGAAAAASDLIKLDPQDDSGYYLRALANDRSGEAKKAIDDYAIAIALFVNKSSMSSDNALAMARNYDKLGQPCDAELAVEAWVALNPQRNDSSRIQAIIADYTAKGKCDAPGARSEEVIKVPPNHNVIRLPVVINGVRGTFIMDTGASFVTLSAGFAEKSKIQVDQDAKLKLHTANGTVDGKLGHAATIQLRSLQAKDVVVAIQPSTQATYGDGVDGLLGMSFLSRFKVSIEPESIRISSRSGK